MKIKLSLSLWHRILIGWLFVMFALAIYLQHGKLPWSLLQWLGYIVVFFISTLFIIFILLFKIDHDIRRDDPMCDEYPVRKISKKTCHE